MGVLDSRALQMLLWWWLLKNWLLRARLLLLYKKVVSWIPPPNIASKLIAKTYRQELIDKSYRQFLSIHLEKTYCENLSTVDKFSLRPVFSYIHFLEVFSTYFYTNLKEYFFFYRPVFQQLWWQKSPGRWSGVPLATARGTPVLCRSRAINM